MVDAGAGPASPEWEYEYDESATDDFYFTLDLSARQPSAPRSYPRKRKRGDARDGGGDGEDGDHAAASAPATPEPPHGPSTATATSGPPDEEAPPPQQRARALQVLGLDTANPLVKLDNALYSCHWSTDLGTQFHLARPGAVDAVLKPGHRVDVVALSRVRLTGTPAVLREKERPAGDRVRGASEGDAIALSDDDDDDADDADVAGNPSRGRPDSHAAAAKAQPSFLERLAAIKREKGEMDAIPWDGTARYRRPEDAAEIRARAEVANADRLGGPVGRSAPRDRLSRVETREADAEDGGTVDSDSGSAGSDADSSVPPDA